MCRLAAESAGSAASGELDTSKPNLTVSQNWWLTIMEKQMGILTAVLRYHTEMHI